MGEWKYVCLHEYIFLTQECGTITVDGCFSKNETVFPALYLKGHCGLMRVTAKTNDRGQKAVCTLVQRGEDSGSDS